MNYLYFINHRSRIKNDSSITARSVYKFDRDSVKRLNSYISRHHLAKPAYLDADMVFTAVKRCNDEYSNIDSSTSKNCVNFPYNDEFQKDIRDSIHMLLATAISSNW